MPGLHGGTVAVLDLCAYCETPTTLACRLCQRAVCASHVVEDEDVCLDCGAAQTDE